MAGSKGVTMMMGGGMCSGLLVTAAVIAGRMPSSEVAARGPCTGRPEYHQMDYFLGYWLVKAPDGSAEGRSTVRTILDGCAIEEDWESSGGYAGQTTHAYFSEDGRWHEFYLDNQGKVHSFVGTPSDSGMRYEGTSRDSAGQTVLHRLRIIRRPSGDVDQLWEKSFDGGQRWTTAFHAIYARVGR